MKIIDAHIHSTFSDILIKNSEKLSETDYSRKGLIKELKDNNISYAISMQIESGDGTFNNTFGILKEFSSISNVFDILAINPYDGLLKNQNNLKKYEDILKQNKVKGLKIYLGYYHFYAYDSVYKPFYNLAKKYSIPVIFHTGDNYCKTAKLKFAHPLTIDEVAVDNPDVTFIMAHMGNPWLIDAAEVLYKNKNVYADLSGLLEGKKFNIDKNFPSLLRQATVYAGYDKLMYGSDWPLVLMKPYISMIKKLIPKKYYEDVFYNTAKKIFKL